LLAILAVTPSINEHVELVGTPLTVTAFNDSILKPGLSYTDTCKQVLQHAEVSSRPFDIVVV
jgi:hypothetical protein